MGMGCVVVGGCVVVVVSCFFVVVLVGTAVVVVLYRCCGWVLCFTVVTFSVWMIDPVEVPGAVVALVGGDVDGVGGFFVVGMVGSVNLLVVVDPSENGCVVPVGVFAVVDILCLPVDGVFLGFVIIVVGTLGVVDSEGGGPVVVVGTLGVVVLVSVVVDSVGTAVVVTFAKGVVVGQLFSSSPSGQSFSPSQRYLKAMHS